MVNRTIISPFLYLRVRAISASHVQLIFVSFFFFLEIKFGSKDDILFLMLREVIKICDIHLFFYQFLFICILSTNKRWWQLESITF